MRPPRSIHALIVLVIAACGVALPVRAQTAETTKTQPPRTHWDELEPAERDMVLSMLNSPDWPFRVFGIIRLERYTGDPVTRLLGNGIKDDEWQVRCFSIRQAQRMDVPITPSDLASENDARVLRAALAHGVAIPAERIAPIARKLMRSQQFDDVMLGIELAAAVDDSKLREDAANVVRRLINNMSDALAAYIGKRLSHVVGLRDPMRTAREWQQWFNSVRGEIVFTAPPAAFDPLAGTTFVHDRPIIAEMDSSSFARLVDYLSALRQRDLDVVIAMDSTASMLPMISEARAGTDALIQFMCDLSRTMRFGFVAYRDHDNPPVCEVQPLTDDIASVRNFLFRVRITGGADLPEAVYDGLEECTKMRFRETATRQVILVGDAPPHRNDSARLLKLLESYDEEGVTVHAAHVPMEYDQQYTAGLTADEADQQRRFLEEYNNSTATAFAEISNRGRGQYVQLRRAEELVPAVMHFSIERAWWPVFDEFYENYRALCR